MQQRCGEMNDEVSEYYEYWRRDSVHGDRFIFSINAAPKSKAPGKWARIVWAIVFGIVFVKPGSQFAEFIINSGFVKHFLEGIGPFDQVTVENIHLVMYFGLLIAFAAYLSSVVIDLVVWAYELFNPSCEVLAFDDGLLLVARMNRFDKGSWWQVPIDQIVKIDFKDGLSILYSKGGSKSDFPIDKLRRVEDRLPLYPGKADRKRAVDSLLIARHHGRIPVAIQVET